MMRKLMIGLAAAALLLSACMGYPEDGQPVRTPDAQVTFSGFTLSPSTTVHVQAWNWAKNTWETIATTASITVPFPYGNRKGYFWSTTAQVARTSAINSGITNPTLCRWSKACMIGPGDSFARVRAVVGDSASSQLLFVLDQGGHSCVTGKISSGEETDVAVAYVDCKKGDWYVVRLHYIG